MDYPTPGNEPFSADPGDMESAWKGDIRPIETLYRGYLFRSRLEARWAVAFDYLRIEFLYEPDGFKLDAGWYLPDFYLPQIRSFAEVKPAEFDATALAKCTEICLRTGNQFLLLSGPPDFRLYRALERHGGIDAGCDSTADVAVTEYNALLDIDYHGRRYYEQERRLYADPGEDLNLPSDFSESYQQAVYASRQARFDGVTPCAG